MAEKSDRGGIENTGKGVFVEPNVSTGKTSWLQIQGFKDSL